MGKKDKFDFTEFTHFLVPSAYLRRVDLAKQRSFSYKKLVILTIFLVVLWHKPILRLFFVLDYGNQIVAYSRENQVNPAMISAIVFTESRFDTLAKSHKGALGLMQIMPETGAGVARELNWEEFSSNDLLDPDKNLRIGIWYIAYLKRQFNYNDYLALASYNAGLSNVNNWITEGTWDGDTVRIEQIPFPETKKYLLQIMFLKRIYSYLYSDFLS